MHFKHFPQLHFPPPVMADFLLMLSCFMSLDRGLRGIELSPPLAGLLSDSQLNRGENSWLHQVEQLLDLREW